MALKGVKRGPYQQDFLSARADGYVYHRAVPMKLQPLVGRKSWHVWLGSSRKLSGDEAARSAREHAVAHDRVIASVEKLSAAERGGIIAEGGLEQWSRGVLVAQTHAPLVKLAAELSPDPDQPDGMQAQDALTAVRARDYLATLEKDSRTARKLAGDNSDTLTGLIDLWKKVKQPRNPATAPTVRRYMQWFIDAIGDKDPKAVKADHVRTFRNKLEKDGKTFETIKKSLERLSAVFNVAVAEGMCDANPFHKIKPHGRPAEKRSVTRRLPWTPEQLRTIAARCDEMGADEGIATRMLIFSGARPNEIAQLRCDDLVTVEGIDALRITDEGPQQSLKNEDSRRTVPIHPAMRAEVLAQVAARRKAGKDRLFDFGYMPSLGTFSHAYGQRFTKWKRSVGFTSSRQVAHSFRHSFKDAARAAKLPSYVINQLVGHEFEKGSAGGYGVGINMRELAEAIGAVDPLR